MALDLGMDPLHDCATKEEFAALLKQHLMRFCYVIDCLGRGDVEEFGGGPTPRRLRLTPDCQAGLREAAVKYLVAIDESIDVEVSPAWRARHDPDFREFMEHAVAKPRRARKGA